VKNKFKVKAKVWKWKGDAPAAWHFVTIPPETSEIISKQFHGLKRGWGSLPVLVEFELTKEARAEPAPQKSIFKKKTTSKKTNKDIIINKNKIKFETSIFANKKDKLYMTYLLPLKKTVRSELGIQDGDVVDFVLHIKTS
jgi:hypothetical protein